nr:hypothetical protein Csa_3G150005 [Ipomoea batatas]
MEVLGSTPPSKTARHSAFFPESLRSTMEFDPVIVQLALCPCRTRVIHGTDAPSRVASTLSGLKQTSNGLTAATLVMFLAAAALMKAFVTALKMEVSRTVSGVYVNSSDASTFCRKWYGPSPKKMTPVDDDKQTANFRWKLKAAENCDGTPTRVRPRPAIPTAPLASPSKSEVGAQEKIKRETSAAFPGLNPLVDLTDTTSSASSPLVEVRVMGLCGKTPQVLLLHPGLGPEKQSPQAVFFVAREHCADRHRTGR